MVYKIGNGSRISDDSLVPATMTEGASREVNDDDWPELLKKSEYFWIEFWINKFARDDQEKADFRGMLLDE